MKTRLTSMALVLAAATASEAAAAEPRGTFTTVMTGRQDARRGDLVSVVPVYELASLEVDALSLPGADDARVVLQGWGRLELGEDELTGTTADLGLLYLDAQNGPLALRLGRQHAVFGAARMTMIDGAHARLSLGHGLALQAFLGAVVHPELRYETGDWDSGARASVNLQPFDQLGELGVSYRQRRHRNDLRRNDVGLDGFLVLGPTRWVALAVANLAAKRLAEARVATTFSPAPQWTLTVDVERVEPSAFLRADSIFWVFADSVHDALGGDVAWQPSDYYSLSVSGHLVLLDADLLGYRGHLRAETFRDASQRSRIGVEIGRIDESDNGMIRGRVFTGLQLLETLRVSADSFIYHFDEPINGVTSSALLQGSVSYDVATSLRVAVTVSGGVTPWAERQFEAMARLAYGYNVDFGREVGP